MGMFETHHAKTIHVGSGVALQTPIPVHTTGHKKVHCIPGMGAFETHSAKKYRVGSGVALQTPIPVHTTGAQKVFLDTWDWCA